MSVQEGLSKDALAKIRGLTDAALVSIYRSTKLRKGRGFEGLMSALEDEIRRRPHIDLDDSGFVNNINADDGFGSLLRWTGLDQP